MKNKNKILVSLLTVLVAFLPASAASRYTSLDFISGINPDVDLQIRNSDLNGINLLKRDNVRLRVKGIRNLVTDTVETWGVITVNMYEINSASRDFVGSQKLTVRSTSTGRRVISFDVGRFNATTKEVEFDLIDTNNNLINTYSATLTANNISAQASSGSGLDLATTCDPTVDFDECLELFWAKTSLIARPARQSSTIVEKDSTTNLWTAQIPIPRRSFKAVNGNRRRVSVNSSGTTTGGTTANFGETVDASTVRFGSSALDFTNLTYNSSNGTFMIGNGESATSVSQNFFFTNSGKLGIGVDNPNAFLHVRSADGSSMPSMVLEPGTLSSGLINGALEFDGSDLYITKNGVRTVLGAGATGAQGPQGPQGATGAAGADGATGTIASNSGVIIANGGILLSNGSITGDPVTIYNGNLLATTTINGTLNIINGATAGFVLTSDANGNATWQASTSGLTSNGATLTNSDFNNATLNGSTAFTPSGTTLMNAATALTVTNPIMRIAGDGSAQIMTANPQINDGASDGQLLVIKGTDSTNFVRFVNGNGLKLAFGTSFTVGAGDMLTLIYDAVDDEWIELSRSDN